MMCHQHKHPDPIQQFSPEVPNDMVLIVERLMQKAPENRYPSCAEVIEALRAHAAPAAGAAQGRRRTMQMPRVKLPARNGGIAEPIAPPPTSAPELSAQRPAVPRTGQPLPPRSPSAPANKAGGSLRPSDQGRKPSPPPRPSEQGARRPAPPPGFTRPSEHGKKPAPAPAPAPAPEPAHSEEEHAPRRPRARFSLITVILMAILAGVAAFFLSRLIPV
jgi:hypothetical protein